MLRGVIKMIWFNLLKRIILSENYETKKEVQEKTDNFYKSGKITETQKNELERMLNSTN